MAFQDPSIPKLGRQSVAHEERVVRNERSIPTWILAAQDDRNRSAGIEVVLPVGEVHAQV